MISLSDPELAAIMDAAKPIPARDRDAFLQAVTAELQRYPEVGIGIIHRVTAKQRASRDVQTSISTLEDFCDIGKPLPMPLLQALAKEFFNAEIDEASGLLQSLNRTPPVVLAPVRAEPSDPTTARYFQEPERNPLSRAPQPVVPKKVATKKGRPGWIGGWL